MCCYINLLLYCAPCPLLIGDNYKWWCQKRNIGDHQGCLEGKYKPFGKTNWLPSLKKTLEPFRARFVNTMGNPFFYFSEHRPSGLMLPLSWFVHMCVCLYVCLCVCSLLRYRFNVLLPPRPKVGCPKNLDIRNPWGKVKKRSCFRFESIY